MIDFKKVKDRRGDYGVSWSQLREVEPIQQRKELIPFAAGDARVPSLPASETMVTAVGAGQLTHGVIALRIGKRAVHVGMSAGQCRAMADALRGNVDLLDGGAK